MSIRVNGKVIASNGDVKTETDNLVTTDTNQTITATKVFTAEQQKKSTVIDITTQPENYSPNNAFRFLDKNGKISGWIENAQMASGEITTGIHARNKDGYQPRVSVFAPLTGMTGAYAIALLHLKTHLLMLSLQKVMLTVNLVALNYLTLHLHL